MGRGPGEEPGHLSPGAGARVAQRAAVPDLRSLRDEGLAARRGRPDAGILARPSLSHQTPRGRTPEEGSATAGNACCTRIARSGLSCPWSLVIGHWFVVRGHLAFFIRHRPRPPSPIAYRLSPIAYRLSPIAYRLSPIANWSLVTGHWSSAIGYRLSPPPPPPPPHPTRKEIFFTTSLPMASWTRSMISRRR